MHVVVEAFWDEEARVWVASALGDLGLVTEAETVEKLQRRIANLLPGLLADDDHGPHEVELVTRSLQVIAA